MNYFNPKEIKNLYIPPKGSHKGQNGKLLIIAGSKLFHAPAIWSAEIASRIVDMVYISSSPENNEILQNIRGKFWNGILIRREDLDSYAREADCILIGPGLPRKDGEQAGDDDTCELTKHVLTEFCNKSNDKSQTSKVVIDGGALQVMEEEWIPEGAILTPHEREFCTLFGFKNLDSRFRNKIVAEKAKEHNCIILLKGVEDVVCSSGERRVVKGGNAGMTKGGTGDVLAGLVAALACKNDPYLSALAGSYINKAAGDSLYKEVGYTYNSSDLIKEIPKIIKSLTLD